VGLCLLISFFFFFSVDWPCGLSNEMNGDGTARLCYANTGHSGLSGETMCAVACSNNMHYEVKANGRCGLKNCDERTKNASSDFPCGPDNCYWDKGNTVADTCIDSSTSCANSNHYTKQDSNFTCILKSCESRTKNSSTSEPCGPDNCYWDKGNTVADTCIDSSTSCANSNHYTKQDSNFTCILKSCESRTKNSSTSEPCGPDDCYWDMGDTSGSNDRCIEEGDSPGTTACTHPSHFAVEKSGLSNYTCVWKDCGDREENSMFVDCIEV
jgi:hypothetical protein